MEWNEEKNWNEIRNCRPLLSGLEGIYGEKVWANGRCMETTDSLILSIMLLASSGERLKRTTGSDSTSSFESPPEIHSSFTA